MNIERLQQLIDIMQRVVDRGDKLDLAHWQQHKSIDGPAKTEEALHSCGSPACVGGWLAVSPEFQQAGGEPAGMTGVPLITDGPNTRPKLGEHAVSHWLECDLEIAQIITGTYDIDDTWDFYDVEDTPDITPQHVVNALTLLLRETENDQS